MLKKITFLLFVIQFSHISFSQSSKIFDYKMSYEKAEKEFKLKHYPETLDILLVPFHSAKEERKIDRNFLFKMSLLIFKSYYLNKNWSLALSFGLDNIYLTESLTGENLNYLPIYHHYLAKSYDKTGDSINSLYYHNLIADFYINKYGEEDKSLLYPYMDIGIDYSFLKKPSKSIEYLIKSLNISIREEGVLGVNTSSLLSVIADRYQELNEIDKTTLFKGLYKSSNLKPSPVEFENKLKKQINKELSAIYLSKADRLKSIGRINEALFYHLKSLQLLKKINPTDINLIISYNNIGNIYYSLNNYNFALIYFMDAYDLVKKNSLGNKLIASAVYNNLGSLYFSLQKYDKAYFYYVLDASILQNIKGDNNAELGIAYNNISQVFSMQENFKQALKYAQKSKYIYLKVYGENNFRYANLLNNIGVLFSKQNNYIEAISNFKKALNIYLKTYNYTNQEILIVYENLSTAFYLNKQKNEALKYINIKTKLQNEYLTKYFYNMPSSLKEKFALYSKTSMNILNSITQTSENLSDSDLIKGYENNMKFKKILFHSESKLRKLISSSTDQHLKELFNNLNSVNTEIYKQQFKTNKIFGVNKLDSLKIIHQILESTIANRNSVIHKFSKPNKINFQNIKKALLPYQAAIEIVSFELYNYESYTNRKFNFAYIIRSTWEKPKLVKLFEDSELLTVLNKSKNVLPSIQYKRMYDHKTNGKELYDLCWSSIDKHLDGIKTIFISTAGLINNIAIPILPLEQGGLLSDKYNFHYLSSTADIIMNNYDFNEKLESINFFSGINYDENNIKIINKDLKPRHSGLQCNANNWGQLPAFSQTDLTYKYIKSFIKKFVLSNGSNATKQAFFNMDGTSPDIIHLYTHGFYCEIEKDLVKKISFKSNNFNAYKHHNNPLIRAGLIMAGGNIGWKKGTNQGVLTAYEILQMDLSNTKLCVLGACGTGLGDINDYEGVFGLQRALKIAGVKNIIMSLWPVTDLHTKLFFEIFYKKLSENLSIRESFYFAQNKMRKKLPNRPDLWGAFILLE